MTLGRTLRVVPALLRIGFAETVAYRAELVIWILTTTEPLIMLALWTSVAAEAPFRGYSSQAFIAYFLATLIVRNLTSTWVSWQITEEIRAGTMAIRLLRPVHPFIAFTASHAAAVPIRGLVALPLAGVLLLSSGASALTTAPLQLALALPSIALAWLITFSLMFAFGALGFFLTRTQALVTLHFALFSLLSGYLLPLPLLPGWIGEIAAWTPYRSMLSVPVELLTRAMTRTEVAQLMLGQLAWAAAMLAIALWLWRRGVRRFESVGG